ncbi:hypothetical protein AMTR_s00120p00130520, partial [Amborella trichopoda]
GHLAMQHGLQQMRSPSLQVKLFDQSWGSSLAVERDSKNVMNWTNRMSTLPWSLKQVLEEVIELSGLPASYKYVSITWREANAKMDTLAKEGASPTKFLNFPPTVVK